MYRADSGWDVVQVRDNWRKVACINEAQCLDAKARAGTTSSAIHRNERVENATRGDHDQCNRGFRNERAEVATRAIGDEMKRTSGSGKHVVEDADPTTTTMRATSQKP